MRSLPMCAAWLILTGVSVALLFVRTNPLESLFLLLLIICEMQAFVAEALGIRVSKKSISFPRRSIPDLPFVVLWRARIECADINQISSRPKARARMEKSTGERLRLDFPSREARLRFFRLVKRANRWISIYGARPRHRRGFDRPAGPRQSWAVTERSSAKSAGAAENKIKMLAKQQNRYVCNKLMAVKVERPR